MARYRIFCVLLLITLAARGQQGTPILNPLKEKYASFKNLVDVNSAAWNIGMKGINSISLFFTVGDTVTYSISRERTRNATFFLLDSSNVLVNMKFKSNVITGHFIVTQPGMYLFKVKNHSFLGNKFSLDVKKKGALPKIEKPIQQDTLYRSTDSLVTLLDSTVYLACTLNLNQPTTFTLPYKINKKYGGIILKSIDVSLSTTPASSKTTRKSKTKIIPTCAEKTVENPADGYYIIYLHDLNIKSHFVDSLKNSIEKGEQICRTTLGSRSNPQNLVLENDDKVLGKHVLIQLKEIKTTRKPVVPNAN